MYIKRPKYEIVYIYLMNNHICVYHSHKIITDVSEFHGWPLFYETVNTFYTHSALYNNTRA